MILDTKKADNILSEDDKLQERYLKAQVDATIAAVRGVDRKEVQKAYDAKNGVREKDAFAYLWQAYGMEFPSKLRHIPVLRAVFDSLVGKYINQPFKWQVTSSDKESIDEIFNEYRDAINRDVEQYYVSRVKAAEMLSDQPGAEGERAKQYLESLKKKYQGGSFISELETDAKNVLAWSIHRFELKSKIVDMFTDLSTAGEAYYQVKVQNVGEKPLIRVINPLEVYLTKNRNVKLVRDCERIALKEKLTVAEIWTRYGSQMKKEDAKRFLSKYQDYIINSDIEIVYYELGNLEGGAGSRFESGQKNMQMEELDVWYTEWKANTRLETKELPENHLEGETQDALAKLQTKYKYRLDLFEGTKIADDIYVGLGRNKFAVRHPDDPGNVWLTINGIHYNDRNGEPYRLPLKVKDIGDLIDVIHYHAENALALSGSKLVMVDLPNIPAFITGSPVQRVMKWLGYAKQGIGLSDTSQDGAGKFQQGGSQIDMSLSNSVQYILDMADRLEGTAYKIIGLSRQSIGNITQSDGKGTSELAIQGSETVIKPLFYTMDILAACFMSDVTNACRTSYKSGITGTILNGIVGQRVFSIKSKRFPLAFLNVFIENEGDTERDLDAIRAVAQQLIEAQLLDPILAVDMVTVKSLTEIKKMVRESVESQKASKEQQSQQQLAEYEKQLQEAQAQIEKLSQGQSQAEMLKVQEDSKRGQAELELKAKEHDHKVLNDAEKLKIENKRVDLEALQLSYGNGGNAEIKNS